MLSDGRDIAGGGCIYSMFTVECRKSSLPLLVLVNEKITLIREDAPGCFDLSDKVSYCSLPVRRTLSRIAT